MAVYDKIEDIYYSAIEALDSKGVPIRAITDPIEKAGIPSMLALGGVLVLLLALVAVALLPGIGVSVPVSITVKAGGTPVADAEIAAVFGLGELSVFSDEGGVASFKVPKGEELEMDITKAGCKAQHKAVTAEEAIDMVVNLKCGKSTTPTQCMEDAEEYTFGSLRTETFDVPTGCTITTDYGRLDWSVQGNTLQMPYSTDACPEEDQVVTISCNGYKYTASMQETINKVAAGQEIVLSSTMPLTTHNTQYDSAVTIASQTYTIYVTVKDNKGKALDGMRVSAVRATGETLTSSYVNTIYQKTTGSDGIAQLVIEANRDFYVKAEDLAGNYGPKTTKEKIVATKQQSVTVTLKEGYDTTVTVKDDAGNPVKGASVLLKEGETKVTSGVTKEDGTITLAAGMKEYALHVTLEGYAPYNGAVTGGTSADVVLTKLTDENSGLVAAIVVNAEGIGEAVPGIVLHLIDATGLEAKTCTSGATGECALGRVLVGTYTIYADLSTGSEKAGQSTEPFEVKAGETATPGLKVMLPKVMLSIKTNVLGDPLDGVQVEVWDVTYNKRFPYLLFEGESGMTRSVDVELAKNSEVYVKAITEREGEFYGPVVSEYFKVMQDMDYKVNLELMTLDIKVELLDENGQAATSFVEGKDYTARVYFNLPYFDPQTKEKFDSARFEFWTGKAGRIEDVLDTPIIIKPVEENDYAQQQWPRVTSVFTASSYSYGKEPASGRAAAKSSKYFSIEIDDYKENMTYMFDIPLHTRWGVSKQELTETMVNYRAEWVTAEGDVFTTKEGEWTEDPVSITSAAEARNWKFLEDNPYFYLYDAWLSSDVNGQNILSDPTISEGGTFYLQLRAIARTSTEAYTLPIKTLPTGPFPYATPIGYSGEIKRTDGAVQRVYPYKVTSGQHLNPVGENPDLSGAKGHLYRLDSDDLLSLAIKMKAQLNVALKVQEVTDVVTTYVFNDEDNHDIEFYVKDLPDSEIGPISNLATRIYVASEMKNFEFDFTDSDDDGMPDDWETASGLDPNDAADAILDPDIDGITNLGDWQAHARDNNIDIGSKPAVFNHKTDTVPSYSFPKEQPKQPRIFATLIELENQDEGEAKDVNVVLMDKHAGVDAWAKFYENPWPITIDKGVADVWSVGKTGVIWGNNISTEKPVSIHIFEDDAEVKLIGATGRDGVYAAHWMPTDTGEFTIKARIFIGDDASRDPVTGEATCCSYEASKEVMVRSLPDLSVSSLSTDGELVQGGKINILTTVKNMDDREALVADPDGDGKNDIRPTLTAFTTPHTAIDVIEVRDLDNLGPGGVSPQQTISNHVLDYYGKTRITVCVNYTVEGKIITSTQDSDPSNDYKTITIDVAPTKDEGLVDIEVKDQRILELNAAKEVVGETGEVEVGTTVRITGIIVNNNNTNDVTDFSKGVLAEMQNITDNVPLNSVMILNDAQGVPVPIDGTKNIAKKAQDGTLSYINFTHDTKLDAGSYEFVICALQKDKATGRKKLQDRFPENCKSVSLEVTALAPAIQAAPEGVPDLDDFLPEVAQQALDLGVADPINLNVLIEREMREEAVKALIAVPRTGEPTLEKFSESLAIGIGEKKWVPVVAQGNFVIENGKSLANEESTMELYMWEEGEEVPNTPWEGGSYRHGWVDYDIELAAKDAEGGLLDPPDFKSKKLIVFIRKDCASGTKYLGVNTLVDDVAKITSPDAIVDGTQLAYLDYGTAGTEKPEFVHTLAEDITYGQIKITVDGVAFGDKEKIFDIGGIGYEQETPIIWLIEEDQNYMTTLTLYNHYGEDAKLGAISMLPAHLKTLLNIRGEVREVRNSDNVMQADLTKIPKGGFAKIGIFGTYQAPCAGLHEAFLNVPIKEKAEDFAIPYYIMCSKKPAVAGIYREGALPADLFVNGGCYADDGKLCDAEQLSYAILHDLVAGEESGTYLVGNEQFSTSEIQLAFDTLNSLPQPPDLGGYRAVYSYADLLEGAQGVADTNVDEVFVDGEAGCGGMLVFFSDLEDEDGDNDKLISISGESNMPWCDKTKGTWAVGVFNYDGGFRVAPAGKFTYANMHHDQLTTIKNTLSAVQQKNLFGWGSTGFWGGAWTIAGSTYTLKWEDRSNNQQLPARGIKGYHDIAGNTITFGLEYGTHYTANPNDPAVAKANQAIVKILYHYWTTGSARGYWASAGLDDDEIAELVMPDMQGGLFDVPSLTTVVSGGGGGEGTSWDWTNPVVLYDFG